MPSLRRPPSADRADGADHGARAARGRPRGMRVVIALLLVAGLAVTVHLPAAQAAAPVPATPSFTAAIDPYPGYDPEDTCSATAKPGVVAFRDLLVRTYGSRWNNIVRSCSGSVSGHEEGRSLDFRFLASDSAQLAQANAVLGWLLATDKYGNKHANARRLGLMYVQFNNKMWRGYNASAGWLPQTVTVGGVKRDCATLGATYVTRCHRDHIHFSFSWDGAYKRTSFFLGRLPCDPPLTTNSTPPTVPSAPTRFVGVPAAVVLDTVTGLGTPAGACSLAAMVPYDVSVTGRGGVPSSGVTAVDLLVTTHRATAATWVTVGPSGAAWNLSGRVRVLPVGGGRAHVTVPVGTDGKLRFRVGSGYVDLRAVVLGYRTAEGGATYTPVPTTIVRRPGTTLLAPGARVAIPVTGVAGVPVGASAVTVTLSSTSGAVAGVLAVGPNGTTSPAARLENPAGQTASTTLSVQVGTNGALTLVNVGRTSADAHVMLHGWFGDAPAGARFVPTVPATVLSTGTNVGHTGPLGAGETMTLPIAGRAGVPANAKAVVLDLATTGSTVPTWILAWQTGGSTPRAAWRHVSPGVSAAGQLIVPLGTGGAINLYNGRGTLPMTGNVVGYYV